MNEDTPLWMRLLWRINAGHHLTHEDVELIKNGNHEADCEKGEGQEGRRCTCGYWELAEMAWNIGFTPSLAQDWSPPRRKFVVNPDFEFELLGRMEERGLLGTSKLP